MGLSVFKSGIRTKINMGIMTIVLVSVLLVALAASQIVSRALFQEYRNRGISLAVNLAARSQDPILAMDFLRMRRLIGEMTTSAGDIRYVFIQDTDGEVLSHTFSDGFPVQLKSANQAQPTQRCSIRLLASGKDRYYDFAAPVVVGEFQVGTIRLGLLRSQVTTTVKELWWAIFAFAILSIVISDTVGFSLAHNLTSRIKRLQMASEEMLKGHGQVDAAASAPNLSDATSTTPARASLPAGPLAGDEIHQLAHTFDAMTSAIRRYIEELAASKAVLAKSETKYRRIFEDSMDLIFVADHRGRLLDINPAGIQMLGYDSRRNLMARETLTSLVRNTDETRRLFDEIERNGFVKDWECLLRTRKGGELAVLLSMTTRVDATGRVREYEGIVKDITQRKLMHRQLLQADRLASLGQLAAGIAHEINNPLGLILGYTQLLLREGAEAVEFKDDLRTIEKQTRNCKKIVEDLLNFARKSGTRISEVDINSALQGVIKVVRNQLELDNILIQTHFDDHLPEIAGDAEKLKQVFMNLLLNARQAIRKNGIIIITTTADPDQRGVVIDFEDDGPGMAPEVQDKIFDPFFTTKPTGQGTGLGLSVSYGIIEDHQGDIHVSSEVGRGTHIRIRLPMGAGTNLQDQSQ
ncbi:MAG: ATP-binding protein [Desulfobacterales bacterium]